MLLVIVLEKLLEPTDTDLKIKSKPPSFTLWSLSFTVVGTVGTSAHTYTVIGTMFGLNDISSNKLA